MHLFSATGWSGTISDCNEGILQWIDRKHLSNLNLWQGDRIFLKLLLDNQPFFSLKLSYRGDDLIAAKLNGVSLNLDDSSNHI